MAKFHSTLSRRDFMKAVGLGAVGIGAVAASAPVFHDLDEISSGGSSSWGGSSNVASIQGGANFPWWIKKKDYYDPTTEVDWNMRKRIVFRHGWATGPGGVAMPPTDGESTIVRQSREEEDEMVRSRLTKRYDGFINKEPGNSLRDFAFSASCAVSAGAPPLTGGNISSISSSGGRILDGTTLTLGNKTFTYDEVLRPIYPADIGIPRWEGTPEENLNMLRRVGSFFGVPIVGALEMGPQLKKLVYQTLQGVEVVWDDEIGETNEKPYQTSQTSGMLVLPRSLRWVMVAQIPQSGMTRLTQSYLGGASSPLGYGDERTISARLSNFIATLGYNQAYGVFCSNPGLGICGGLGELGRHDYLVSPVIGSNVRYTAFIFTDLPLTPTPPIDAGIFRFCHNCKKCADMCPGESIPFENKPTWEITGNWNGVGNNSWHIRYDRCIRWRGTPGGSTADSCQTCMGACVFSKKPFASIHEIIKMAQSTTPIFNGFFRVMDDFFGYGERINPEDFWNMKKMGSFPFNGYGAGIQ